MARFVYDSNIKVYFLPSAIADASAPSLAACQAGTELTAFIPKDGLNPGVTNNRVKGGDLSTTFVDEAMGTYGAALQMDFYHDDTNDIAFDTIGVQFTAGAIVVVRKGPAAVGSKCDVYPDVQFGQPQEMQTGENALQKFKVDIAVRKAPNFHAVMAA